MITHLDRKMHNDSIKKEAEIKKLSIDTGDKMISKTFSYINNNDLSTPTGFDSKKMNAMKFSKRSTSRKSMNNSRAKTIINQSQRNYNEMSIADSDSDQDDGPELSV